MKRAMIFLGLTIFFTSHGMENFIKSVVCIAPPYIISEFLEDNSREECESIKTIWRACKRCKDWLVSHIPSHNTNQAASTHVEPSVACASDAFAELN